MIRFLLQNRPYFLKKWNWRKLVKSMESKIIMCTHFSYQNNFQGISTAESFRANYFDKSVNIKDFLKNKKLDLKSHFSYCHNMVTISHKKHFSSWYLIHLQVFLSGRLVAKIVGLSNSQKRGHLFCKRILKLTISWKIWEDGGGKICNIKTEMLLIGCLYFWN